MIFATKESGLRGAMETASGFIGENTLCSLCSTAMSSDETIGRALCERNVLYCTAQGMDAVKVRQCADLRACGHDCAGRKAAGRVSLRVQQIADFLNTHGVTAQPVGDMVRRPMGKADAQRRH